MKIAVIGTGNVGVAFAADLSIKGHEVTLLKTSSYKSDAFDRLIKNGNRVFLKENQHIRKLQSKKFLKTSVKWQTQKLYSVLFRVTIMKN